MTVAPRRLVLLAADDASIEQVRSVYLGDLELIALCWSAPTPEAAESLSHGTVVTLSTLPAPLSERVMKATGLLALSRWMQRTSPGRLLDSLGPAHRSRLFAARVRASHTWVPKAGDAVIALDLPAARTAWFAQHQTVDVTATLSLRAGMARVTPAR